MDQLQNLNPVIQMLVVMTLFSLLPFVFCSMTSFFEICYCIFNAKNSDGYSTSSTCNCNYWAIYNFNILYNGRNIPKMYDMGSVPYQKNHDMIAAINEGSKPLKEFMLKQTRESDLTFFVELAHQTKPKSPDELSIWEIAPAYIISELKTSFEISFIIFVPFIILDLVVANILLALGMFMLSPTIISMPFKLLIFIAVDGWALIVQGLVSSYN